MVILLLSHYQLNAVQDQPLVVYGAPAISENGQKLVESKRNVLNKKKFSVHHCWNWSLILTLILIWRRIPN